MMKRTTLWSIAAMAAFLVVGCSKDSGTDPTDTPPQSVTNESTARVYYANTDEFVNNDEQTIDDMAMQPTEYGTFGMIDAAITPLRWGRFVTSVVRTVTDTVQIGDTVAVTHVHKVITGTFRIRGINGTGDTVVVEKPFVDNSDRNIIFRRVARESRRYWMNWRPVATSLVDGGTPANQINLTRLEFFTGDDTLTITNPLDFYLRYGWMHMPAARSHKDVPEIQGGATVRVRATVISASSDTDLVALRFGWGPLQRRRLAMHCVSQTQVGNEYERVFERSFMMHFHHGAFHAAVEAATHATLYDDAPTAYAVSWWGVPYRVN